MANTKWGLVATILAPTPDILRFAAYHLEAGAHRLYLYLDDPLSDAFAPLKAHPKIRVQKCDPAYWQKNGGARPVKHQVRQSKNATHAYLRKAETEWLAHIDVDEFIFSKQSIERSLTALSPIDLCARIRPMEQLAGSNDTFKAFVPSGPDRASKIESIYPEFGRYLKGGFLSHVAGKLFVRTGLTNVSLRIHNVFQGTTQNPGQTELIDIDLAHCHAKPWGQWLEAYQYRIEKGSYRADLPPARNGEFSLHDALEMLERTEGKKGLKRFFNEVAMDTPDLRDRLRAHNLLRHANLDLDAKLALHFPDFA